MLMVRHILMVEHAVAIPDVKGVAGDVTAPVDDQNSLIALAGEALSDDCASVAGADNHLTIQDKHPGAQIQYPSLGPIRIGPPPFTVAMQQIVNKTIHP